MDRVFIFWKILIEFKYDLKWNKMRISVVLSRFVYERLKFFIKKKEISKFCIF